MLGKIYDGQNVISGFFAERRVSQRTPNIKQHTSKVYGQFLILLILFQGKKNILQSQFHHRSQYPQVINYQSLIHNNIKRENTKRVIQTPSLSQSINTIKPQFLIINQRKHQSLLRVKKRARDKLNNQEDRKKYLITHISLKKL